MASRDGEHFVNIDVTHAGTRYHFEGPRREDVAKAQEDLTYIYSAAATGATRAEGLQAMKAAAKALRDEAKAAAKNVRAATQATTRGSVQNEGATGHYARIQYLEDSKQREFAGPTRRSERRAEADLAKLRQAAQGHATMKESIAAMRQKSRELHHEAEFEANVALGLAQYGFVRDAHKVVDSDPESDGEAPVEAADGDDKPGAVLGNPGAPVLQFF